MPSNVSRTRIPETAPRDAAPRGQVPIVGDLRRLEQKLTPETDYSIESPRREPWAPLFEFPNDN